MLSDRRTLVLLCLAEALSMTGVSLYPALLPILRDEWQVSNTEAGVIGGAFFGGYMIAVPVLVGMTDRVPVRNIYYIGCLLASAGAAGFAALASGSWSAAVWQAVAGAGLAGTYMPGLRELSERITGPRQSRSIAFYTSTYGIGTSASLYFAGVLTRSFGWRSAFAYAAIGPLVAITLLAFLLPARPQRTVSPSTRRLFDFGPVVRNRRAVGFILGYAAHCWELFALRGWMVAYFVFLAARGGAWTWSATTVAAVINLLGPFASILGNELAIGRRRRVIVSVMSGCGVLAIAAGSGAVLPSWIAVGLVVLYFVAIMSDSAALTSGLVESTPTDIRGGAMALHSLAGFGAGLLAPAVFGFALDAGGGDVAIRGWVVGYSTLAAISWAGAWAVFRSK